MTPASIRNNNPGAMEPGPSSRKFGSTSYETLRWSFQGVAKENRIATFPTAQHGAAAQFDLLERCYTDISLKVAVTKWCGSYWSGEYAAALEAACGLSADELLTKELVRDPAHAIPLAKAMAKVEAGVEFPMDDAGWQAAHTMAFSSALAPSPATDNDVPFQRPEARWREAIRLWFRRLLAGGAIGGGATQLPPPPSLADMQGWTTYGNEAVNLLKWAFASPLALAIAAGTAVLLLLPKLWRPS